MAQSYLTKDAAAKRSGRSVRRLLELASTGRIKKRIIRDPANGNRELTLFSSRDIDRLAKGKITPPVSTALQISGPVRHLAALQQGEPASVIPPTPQRPWLTIAEAADYSGLPESFLHSLVTDGKLAALDVGVRAGGRWRIARRDIDAISASNGFS